MKKTLISILVLAGCSGPIPITLSAYDSTGGNPTAETRAILDEAFGAWGLTWEIVPSDSPLSSYGTIDIEIVAPGPSSGIRQLGDTSRDIPCRPAIVAEPSAQVLAHELGHVWELNHHPAEGNMMNETISGGGWDISDRQFEIAENNIALFLACADGA